MAEVRAVGNVEPYTCGSAGGVIITRQACLAAGRGSRLLTRVGLSTAIGVAGHGRSSQLTSLFAFLGHGISRAPSSIVCMCVARSSATAIESAIRGSVTCQRWAT